MDHTNISRYQNPPEQAQYSALSHLNSKQDFLDVCVIGILHRSPIIYVLINITLLIWLAQTIISSKIQQIPKSAFLIAPILGQQPIKDILITKQDICPEKWEKVILRTFPTIFENSFTHKKMTQWYVDGNLSFCIQRINRTLSQFDQNRLCRQNKTQCNGYCFDSQSQCPVTSINSFKVDYQSKFNTQKKIFYTASDGTRYTYSKKQGKPVVNMASVFRNRCANDFHYNDQFTNLTEYEKSLVNCGQQGTVNSFYDKITQMKTQTFMLYNNRPWKPNQGNFNQIELGSIHEIDLNEDISGQCSQLRGKAKKAAQYLFKDPVQPLFTQSLLVIGFILMIAQIIWLTIYVCVNGYFNEKNIIVILICVIQLTVITFIYTQNSRVFETQKFIQSIANCIQSQVSAASTWKFGIQSYSSFTMIQYVGTIFLALYLFAYIMDKLIFEPSSEIYRNFVYDDNNERFSIIAQRQFEGE